MNTCLSCGKPVDNSNTAQWHPTCSKTFFGTTQLPYLELSEFALEQLATETSLAGLTIPGVQKKLSLHLATEKNRHKLTLVGYPAGYILKPQSNEYTQLPELENMVMQLADTARIDTVPHALIRLSDGSLAYISKRIDRIFSKEGVRKIPMEDFCQLSERLTEDKYKGSYEQCSAVLARYSSQRMLDITNFWYLLVFCFITGNSDMHLKNFSLYSPDGIHPVLAPAYDLLPVQLVLPLDTEETALALQGKKSRLNRDDFLHLAQHVGMDLHVCERIITRLAGQFGEFEHIIDRSFISETLKADMKDLLIQRLKRLTRR
jgi:serine/threonine-protein kinase HipA